MRKQRRIVAWQRSQLDRVNMLEMQLNHQLDRHKYMKRISTFSQLHYTPNSNLSIISSRGSPCLAYRIAMVPKVTPTELKLRKETFDTNTRGNYSSLRGSIVDPYFSSSTLLLPILICGTSKSNISSTEAGTVSPMIGLGMVNLTLHLSFSPFCTKKRK